VWPDVKSLPHFKDSFPKFNPKSLEEILPSLDSNAINLLTKMLCYDPNKRITAKQALIHVISNLSSPTSKMSRSKTVYLSNLFIIINLFLLDLCKFRN
jgi:serine/threonine protein kinase